MSRFPYAHAAHDQWPVALAQALAQLQAQMELPDYSGSPSLGLLYLSDHYGPQAQDILASVAAELPLVTDWAGTVGYGICAGAFEYFDEPALAIMLVDVPGDQYRVFSGVSPLGLGFEAHTALVHADGTTPDIAELVFELSQRTQSGFLFGGLSSGRGHALQFAVAGDGNISGHGAASGVFRGGLSGVAFSRGVGIISRVTQGCMPVSREHILSASDGNLMLELDGEPALQVLMADLGASMDRPQEALELLRATLVGFSGAEHKLVQRTGNFGNQVTVRHLIGVDPARGGVAVAGGLKTGMRVAFCQRNLEAARADLVRICAEIRDELETEESPLVTSGAVGPAGGTRATDAESAPGRNILGAVYVSCSGRGGAHFGAPHAELQLVRRSLGDVPLVGFFAGGEIAYDRLYGYTGVLSVFTR